MRWNRLRSAWQVPVVIATVILLGGLSVSHLYLGLDWFSSVLGRLVFGLAWMGVLSIAYLYHQPAGREPRGLLAVACAALIVIGGSDAYRFYRTDAASAGAASVGTTRHNRGSRRRVTISVFHHGMTHIRRLVFRLRRRVSIIRGSSVPPPFRRQRWRR